MAANPGGLPGVLTVDPGATPTYRGLPGAALGSVDAVKSGCADPQQDGPFAWPLAGTPLLATPPPQTSNSRFAFAAAISGRPTALDPQYDWTWSLSG